MASKSSRKLKRNPWRFINGITGPVCGPDSCSLADCGHCPSAHALSPCYQFQLQKEMRLVWGFSVSCEHLLSFAVELFEMSCLLHAVSLYPLPCPITKLSWRNILLGKKFRDKNFRTAEQGRIGHCRGKRVKALELLHCSQDLILDCLGLEIPCSLTQGVG